MNNNKSLERYKNIINDIKIIMTEESDNSIQYLFHSLNWSDTIYRTFNKGLGYTLKSNKHEQLPASLIDYFHTSHLSHILAILRKLYEPKKRGRHSVYSIPTIINIIKSNIGLWVRENYVCYDGYQYETNEQNEWIINNTIEYRHNLFDKICSLNKSGKRNKADKLEIKIIESFEKKAELNKDLRDFANNYLFHAAAKDKRPLEETVYKNTTLIKLQAQMRNAIWIILQLGKLVDQFVSTELAAPQFDPLEAWDKSLFNESIVIKLRKYWGERISWWRKWAEEYWKSDYIYISPRTKYR